MAGGCGSVAARGGRRGKTKWDGECVQQARGVASGRGCDGRMRTARGLREQESGDEWRTCGVVFLKLDHCSSDSVLTSDD